MRTSEIVLKMSSNNLIGFICKNLKRVRSHSSRSIESDELGDNGLILGNVPVPIELIERILCYADEKTLLNCQRVCKQWNELIVDYVWRKKAELKTDCQFPLSDALGWKEFYIICMKIGRNLIKNHSGAEGYKYWHIITQGGGAGWIVEYPPCGAPLLPREPSLNPKQHCFATSFHHCYKQYTVDLVKEGFSIRMLDQISPTIEVRQLFTDKMMQIFPFINLNFFVQISEWYCCRYDCPALYNLQIRLVNKSEKKLDEFTFEDILEGDRQNVWFKVSVMWQLSVFFHVFSAFLVVSKL